MAQGLCSKSLHTAWKSILRRQSRPLSTHQSAFLPGDESNTQPEGQPEDESNTQPEGQPGDDSGNQSGNKPGGDSDNKPGSDSDKKPGSDSDNKPGSDSNKKPGSSPSNPNSSGVGILPPFYGDDLPEEDVEYGDEIIPVVIEVPAGQKYEVTIPAGSDIVSLLDENGYVGFRYLDAVFGGKEITE